MNRPELQELAGNKTESQAFAELNVVAYSNREEEILFGTVYHIN